MQEFDLRDYTNRHSLINRVKRLMWEIVWIIAAKLTPRWCLNWWRCALLRIFGANIGKGCRVLGGTNIWLPEHLEMGNYCWIDNDTRIYNVGKIKLGNNCVVSAGAFLCTAGHNVSSRSFDLKTKEILIGDCVWVASNAIILPGVQIGEGAVVAAGAVVSKNVDPWTVVAGNPAKIIKKRNVTE